MTHIVMGEIVSIEETREINLPHPNWIPGVVRSGFGEVVAVCSSAYSARFGEWYDCVVGSFGV